MKTHAWLFWLPLLLCMACGSNQESSKERSAEGPTVKSDSARQTELQKIVCFGNSLTAGHGVELEQAWPALIQEKIDSAAWNYKVVNAGVSGETTSGGLGRIDWVLKQGVDVFILELGANDGLRGLDPKVTRQNLRKIIARVRETNPGVKILLCGMKVPPNMGPEYTKEFEKVFPKVAKETDVELIPFFLKGVAGKPELNQEDGIHPTPEGHRVIARTVWQHLKPMIAPTKS